MRFGWLEYSTQKNIFLRTLYFFAGYPFLHTQIIARHVFRNGVDFSSKHILDIGTGDGVFAHWLSHKYRSKVIGIDRLDTRLQKADIVAKKYNFNNVFLQRNIEKFGWWQDLDESFDAILLIDILEHLRNRLKSSISW